MFLVDGAFDVTATTSSVLANIPSSTAIDFTARLYQRNTPKFKAKRREERTTLKFKAKRRQE